MKKINTFPKLNSPYKVKKDHIKIRLPEKDGHIQLPETHKDLENHLNYAFCLGYEHAMLYMKNQ